MNTANPMWVWCLIVPTLRVGMPQGTLRVPSPTAAVEPDTDVTQSVTGCIPTQSVGTIIQQRYYEGRARNRRPTTSSTSHPSRNEMAQSNAKSLRMKDSHSTEPRMDMFSST